MMKPYSIFLTTIFFFLQGALVSYAQLSNQNYIHTYEVQIPGVTNPNTLIPSVPLGTAIQTVQYYDGLGRLVQTIQKGITPDGKDLITPIEYNFLGLDVHNYQPFEGNDNSASYRGDFHNELRGFYSGLPMGDIYGEAPVEYEMSPLNRVLKQGAPGQPWQLDAHPVTYSYLTNNTTDNSLIVQKWSVNNNGCIRDGNYGNSQLYANSVTDEDGHEVIEFKDKLGQTILKRSILDAQTFADTYYVYDDLGLLRFVISPEGVLNVPTSFTSENTIARKYVYCYKYDNRKRLIEKQIPGKELEYYVYNKNDQVIMYQDGNMRKLRSLPDGNSSGSAGEPESAFEWMFTKYDALGRVILTGITREFPYQTRSEVQLLADNTEYNYEILSNTSSGTVQDNNYYSNRTFPIIDANYCMLQTLNYYDEYNVCVKNGTSIEWVPIVPDGRLAFDIPEILYEVYLPNLEFTSGLPTASFTFLDRGQIASVNYYDIRNRVIQTRAQNHAGGYDHYTNEYGGLTQRIAKAEHAHCTTFNLESYDFSEETRFVYDDVGRLVSKEYRFNNSIPKQVITNSYDALGRLKSKQIGDENYLLQTVDYTYNMRGWLTKINNPGEVSLNGDFFGEEIFYDIPDNSLSNIGNSRLFNGNISGIKWQSVRPTGIEGPTTTGLKAYVYDYDNLNRLTLGSYLEVEQGSWVNNAKYTESIGPYDLNGNIKSLRRRGICVVNNSPDFLDLLTYTYNGNQVIAVDDEIAVNNTDDFYDNGHYYNQTQETEYRYDGNGNLISDLNKNIIEINYNYLNLPVSFSKRGDNRVEYDYSPQGSKLTQRYLRDGALVKTTDFVANFVYEDGVPAWVIYDEGRVVFDVKGGVFAEAFLKDHLGNVRVAIRRSSGQTTIRQTDSYYPFGMTIRDLSRNGTDVTHKNEYLYNGKMHQDEMGLNLLDYGARFYDAVLGKWHSVDPLAEKSRRWSPFNYCDDNPLRFIDPDGMFKYPANSGYEKQYSTLTSYLKNGGINEILGSKTIMSALNKYSRGQLTPERVAKELKWGSGPTIEITELPYGAPGLYPGGQSKIQLGSNYVNMLENSKSEDKQAALLVVIATLLHEYVHYGDDTGDGRDYNEGFDPKTGERINNEEGDLLEEAIYGTDVSGTGLEEDLQSAKTVINEKSKTEEGSEVLPTVPENK